MPIDEWKEVKEKHESWELLQDEAVRRGYEGSEPWEWNLIFKLVILVHSWLLSLICFTNLFNTLHSARVAKQSELNDN